MAKLKKGDVVYVKPRTDQDVDYGFGEYISATTRSKHDINLFDGAEISIKRHEFVPVDTFFADHLQVGDRLEFIDRWLDKEPRFGTVTAVESMGIYVEGDNPDSYAEGDAVHYLNRQDKFKHTDKQRPEPAKLAELFPGVLAGPGAAPVNPKAAYGATKPDLALIPPVAELHEAMAFEDGARKYGAYNWRTNPVEAMTYVAAMKRHLGLWLDGQEYTSDTNVHNLGAIRACCGILLDCIEAGTLIDNRPPKAPSDAVQLRLKAQKVAEAAARKG